MISNVIPISTQGKAMGYRLIGYIKGFPTREFWLGKRERIIFEKTVGIRAFTNLFSLGEFRSKIRNNQLPPLVKTEFGEKFLMSK